MKVFPPDLRKQWMYESTQELSNFHILFLIAVTITVRRRQAPVTRYPYQHGQLFPPSEIPPSETGSCLEDNQHQNNCKKIQIVLLPLQSSSLFFSPLALMLHENSWPPSVFPREHLISPSHHKTPSLTQFYCLTIQDRSFSQAEDTLLVQDCQWQHTETNFTRFLLYNHPQDISVMFKLCNVFGHHKNSEFIRYYYSTFYGNVLSISK